MADTWKPREKKGTLSTSNRVISPREKNKQEGREEGGSISRWWVIGGGEQGFVPEEAMMMNSGRPGEAAADYSPESPWSPPPARPPAVIYDIFICPLSQWRRLNYATIIVNHGGD